MNTNFEIEENYAVRLNGVHIDLYNNFEFKGISESKNDMIIEFIKLDGEWINETKRPTFVRFLGYTTKHHFILSQINV